MIPIKQILVGTNNSILTTNGSGIIVAVPNTTYLATAGGTITGSIANTATGYLQIAVGTTGQRPTITNGYVRYNTTTSKYEFGVTSGSWINYLNAAGDTFSGDMSNSSTGYLQVAVGTTGQRPTATSGYVRYNTTTSKYEFGVTSVGWKNYVLLDGDSMTGPLYNNTIDSVSTTFSLGTTNATTVLIGNTSTTQVGIGLVAGAAGAILGIRASTVALTSINIAVGSTVTVPNVGDIWMDDTNVFNIHSQLKTLKPSAVGALSVAKAKWKFGQYLVGPVTTDPTAYLEVEVDGIVYQLIISNAHS